MGKKSLLKIKDKKLKKKFVIMSLKNSKPGFPLLLHDEPILLKLTCLNNSPKPSISLLAKSFIASGVVSLPVNPVPPVVMIQSIFLLLENFWIVFLIKFTSSGTGFQEFSFPPVVLTVNAVYSPVSIALTESLVVTPIVRGSIVDNYLYEGGTNYGSDILNFEKKPSVRVQNC